MSDPSLLFEISSVFLVIAIPILILLNMKMMKKSLKMTSSETKMFSLFHLASFVPIFLFLIIILDLGSWLNPYYVLLMAALAMVLSGGGAAFYLQHLVNPRLKRDYGFTYEYLNRNGHGLWKSLDQFEEYKK